MVRRNQDYKHETKFKGLYEIIQAWTNGTVTIQRGAVTSRINIRCIKPYQNSHLD